MTVFVVVVRNRGFNEAYADPQWHIDLAFTSRWRAKERARAIETDAHETQIWKTEVKGHEPE